MSRSNSGATKFIIHHRGEMWPRNATNIESIPRTQEGGGRGIYILFDGSTPVYVGRGNIKHRIKDAKSSKRRGQSWDHFSWYGIPKGHHQQELEALLLRMLPPHLRILNKQRGRLVGAKKHSFTDEKPEPINRPHIFGRSK